MIMRLGDLVEQCEEAEEAQAMVEALEQARRSLSLVLEDWRRRAVHLVGGEVVVADDQRSVLRTSRPRKYRWNHDRIAEAVMDRAFEMAEEYEGDGEYVAECIGSAIRLMTELYVAPATEPRKSAMIEHLGIREPLAFTLSRVETEPRVTRRAR